METPLASTISILICWVAAFLPGAFYFWLFRAFRPTLTGRRKEIRSIMTRGQTFQKYLAAFGAAEDNDLDKTLDAIFYRSFGRSKYYFPLVVLIATTVLGMIVVLTHGGFHLGLPSELSMPIQRLPSSVIAGIGGAFIWGMYDALRRQEAIDLYPVDLHYISLRMIVSPILAPMLTAAFADQIQTTAAFAIGAFPMQTILNFIRGQARTRLGITGLSESAEGPTLHYLQGITPAMLEQLQEQGFESAEHLAGADPIKMLIKTNIEWKVILDLIDQAILFGYVGEKIAILRRLGIRGAIELATLKEAIESDDEGERKRGSDLIACVAKTLEIENPAALNLSTNAFEDVQVNLLWNLWGEASLDEDEAEEARPASASGTAVKGASSGL